MDITTSKQDFFKRVFSHNRREKLISLLCTVMVMLVAVCFTRINKVYTLKVDTKISEDHKVVSGNIDSVEVKVTGNFFELRKVKNEDLVIRFDFSSEKAGEISRNIGDKELPASFAALDVKNISPQLITLITEELKVESEPETPASEEDAAKEPADQEPVEGTVKENKEPAPVQTFHETSPQPERPANEEKNE